MFEPLNHVIQNVIRAWQRNIKNIRWLIGLALVFVIIGLGFAVYVDAWDLSKETGYVGLFFFATGFLILILVAAQEQVRNEQKAEQEVKEVQELARANPDKPEYAWDLAKTKLERYLDRNLSEARGIFVLTTIVMLAGFVLVFYGVVRAFSNPEGLSVSIVSAASGVVLSFIGGSFMLIYRSVLAQSANYVSMLERINAVGMAVHIASTVPDSDGKLKAETTAALARSLLNMYGMSPERAGRKRAG